MIYIIFPSLSPPHGHLSKVTSTRNITRLLYNHVIVVTIIITKCIYKTVIVRIIIFPLYLYLIFVSEITIVYCNTLSRLD